MTISTGTYAARPAGSEGDLYLPSDGLSQYYKNAAAWQPSGPCYPWTIPVNGDFSWTNQGTATVDATYGPVILTAPALAGNSWRIRRKATPSTPYTITAAFYAMSLGVVGPHVGVLFRQSSDGKLIIFSEYFNTRTYYVMKWTDETTYSANYTTLNHTMAPSLCWFRLQDDGVNRSFHWSTDGQYWVQLYSGGRTDFLTADQVGFCANSGNATYPAIITLVHWEEA